MLTYLKKEQNDNAKNILYLKKVIQNKNKKIVFK